MSRNGALGGEPTARVHLDPSSGVPLCLSTIGHDWPDHEKVPPDPLQKLLLTVAYVYAPWVKLLQSSQFPSPLHPLVSTPASPPPPYRCGPFSRKAHDQYLFLQDCPLCVSLSLHNPTTSQSIAARLSRHERINVNYRINGRFKMVERIPVRPNRCESGVVSEGPRWSSETRKEPWRCCRHRATVPAEPLRRRSRRATVYCIKGTPIGSPRYLLNQGHRGYLCGRSCALLCTALGL